MRVMLRLLVVFGGLCFAASLIGCGGASEGRSFQTTASHGGKLLELPNGAGFVELAFEPTTSKVKGSMTQGKVVAYFLSRGGSAPLDPAPSEVEFTDEDGKAHALERALDGTRFESKPLVMPIGSDVPGKLDAKLGGESIVLANRPR